MKTLLLLFLLFLPSACAEEVSHDEKLAMRRAVEFIETTFVRRNLDKGYALLTDKVRAYVPFDKFTEKVASIHRGGYPSKVTAVSVAAFKGEALAAVRLRGEGSGEQFEYSVTLAGHATTDYQVTTFNGRRR